MLLASIVIISFGIGAVSTMAEPYMASASGGSATDQYAETIPELGGEKPTNGSASNPNQASKYIPPEHLAELEAAGAEGAAAADVAIAMVPTPGEAHLGKSGGNPATESLRFENPDTGLSATVSGLSNSGFGILLPILLLFTVAGAAFLSFQARRRRTDEH